MIYGQIIVIFAKNGIPYYWYVMENVSMFLIFNVQNNYLCLKEIGIALIVKKLNYTNLLTKKWKIQ